MLALLIDLTFENTDVRMEEFLYEKLEKMAPVRPNNLELLGECMIDAGHELGPGRAYGESTGAPHVVRLHCTVN